jgi:hypothetical protein
MDYPAERTQPAGFFFVFGKLIKALDTAPEKR